MVEQLIAAAAALLCPVHRRVGVADQGLGPLARFARQRDADTDGHEVLDPTEHERPREQRSDALGDLDRLPFLAQVLDQDGELVAAETGHGVAGAERLLEPRGNSGEQLVAGGVAQAVVD